MGKGDLKTRRGKLFRGSYGRTRPRKGGKPSPVQQAVPTLKKRTTKK
ncbi:MAG TPA: 30S ribosomal protein THX [Bacteroidales bacterium]|nr:30S ribosomal protein THX [Bacteroidales bacterium]